MAAKRQSNLKRKLSRAVLEMKFMKQTKDKVDIELEIEESNALFSDQITKEMKSGANKTIIERSIATCKELTDGRLSYQGMNPEIERLMELRMTGKSDSLNESIEADVTDLEMANYNMQVNEAVAKRFMTKRDRHQPKRVKFMMPDD